MKLIDFNINLIDFDIDVIDFDPSPVGPYRAGYKARHRWWRY